MKKPISSSLILHRVSLAHKRPKPFVPGQVTAGNTHLLTKPSQGTTQEAVENIDIVQQEVRVRDLDVSEQGAEMRKHSAN